MASRPIEDIKAPHRFLSLTEVPRALAELSALPLAAPLLAHAPHGDGHPVLVIPGFTASDRSTGVLRRFLTRLGYDAHTWDLGRNLGPRSIGVWTNGGRRVLNRQIKASGRLRNLPQEIASGQVVEIKHPVLNASAYAAPVMQA